MYEINEYSRGKDFLARMNTIPVKYPGQLHLCEILTHSIRVRRVFAEVAPSAGPAAPGHGCGDKPSSHGCGDKPSSSFPHSSAFALGRGEGRSVPLQLRGVCRVRGGEGLGEAGDETPVPGYHVLCCTNRSLRKSCAAQVCVLVNVTNEQQPLLENKLIPS